MTDSSSPREGWFHPLIAPFEPRVNRRSLLFMGGAGLATALATAPQLSLVSAQTPVATPDASGRPILDQIAGDEEAVAALRAAAQVMADLDSFSFEIETVRGESTIFQGLAVNMISGSVRRPFDFMATVTVVLPFGSLDVTAVGLDGSAWVQDPLSDGGWISLEGTEDIVALVNPDTLILSSVGIIQNAAIDGTENIDGQDATRISGEINFADTASRLAGDDFSLPAEVTSETLPVLVWIDSEQRIVEIEITGPILASESDDVIRSIRFFDFNEPVDIDRPDV